MQKVESSDVCTLSHAHPLATKKTMLMETEISDIHTIWVRRCDCITKPGLDSNWVVVLIVGLFIKMHAQLIPEIVKGMDLKVRLKSD